MKKYFIIYKITNNINGKIYIGKHKTNNLDDDYFGSGFYLNRAKEKYGLQNFTKTILFILQNEEEMNLLEKSVVTPEFCNRTDTYNIMEGGCGGWNYVNLSSDYSVGSENFKNIRRIGGKACQEKYKKDFGSFTAYCLQKMDPQKREQLREIHSQNAKKSNFVTHWIGKHHSEETKRILSLKAKNRQPPNNGKKSFVDINTGKTVYLDKNFKSNNEYVSRAEYNRIKNIKTKKQLIKEINQQKRIDQHKNIYRKYKK